MRFQNEISKIVCVKSVRFYFSKFIGPAQGGRDSRHLIYAFEPETAVLSGEGHQQAARKDNQERKEPSNISPQELIGPWVFAFTGKLLWRTHSNISQQITVAYSQLLFHSLADWKLQPLHASRLSSGANRKD